MPPPARHPPPCGSRSRLPRLCALAAVNELEQSTLATPLELKLEEPSERELETGERKPEPGECEPELGEREPGQGELLAGGVPPWAVSPLVVFPPAVFGGCAPPVLCRA